jgi:hypothetical protein
MQTLVSAGSCCAVLHACALCVHKLLLTYMYTLLLLYCAKLFTATALLHTTTGDG